MRYLLDTNAVIYFLKGLYPSFDLNQTDEVLISFITKIELLAYEASLSEKTNINSFLELVSIQMMDHELIDICIKTRKETKLKIPDAIILSTAIKNRSILVTSDKAMIKKASENSVQCCNPLT